MEKKKSYKIVNDKLDYVKFLMKNQLDKQYSKHIVLIHLKATS